MIQILSATDTHPLQHIGENAGICWHSPITDTEKNIQRAKDCIQSGHGRVLEYVNIEIAVSEYSARVIREIYTHIAGGPTRLQESTRYVNCADFKYFTPPTKSEGAKAYYDETMRIIAERYDKLINEYEMSREDAANVLPLGMHSAIVLKCNLRMLVNFMNQRLCSRAYKEMQKFAKELKQVLEAQGLEWQWISEQLFVPKCQAIGYCTEHKCCGRSPKMTKEQAAEVIKYAKRTFS